MIIHKDITCLPGTGTRNMVSRQRISSRVSQIGTWLFTKISPVYLEQGVGIWSADKGYPAGCHKQEHDYSQRYHLFTRNRKKKHGQQTDDIQQGVTDRNMNIHKDITCLPGTGSRNMVSRQRISSRVSQIGTWLFTKISPVYQEQGVGTWSADRGYPAGCHR